MILSFISKFIMDVVAYLFTAERHADMERDVLVKVRVTSLFTLL